jgi:hypothetical protein
MLHEARNFNATAMRKAGIGPFDLVAIRQAEAALATPSAASELPQAAPEARIAVSLPHPGSPEASAMMDSLLAEYQHPANSKNAARAGWEAARRWLTTSSEAPVPQAEPKAFDLGLVYIPDDQGPEDVRYVREDLALAAMAAAGHAAPAPQAVVGEASEDAQNVLNSWLDNQHPDDVAVDAFASKMRQKMAASRAKGRGGWNDKAQCSAEALSAMLRDHVAKGDPVDVANFAMMLAQRGERIAPSPAPSAAPHQGGPTMADAIAAGDGTLHGAIDYWQGRALAAEAARDVDETNKVLADNYLRATAHHQGADALREDAERLDWIERNVCDVSRLGDSARTVRISWNNGADYAFVGPRYNATWREAIDAARAALAQHQAPQQGAAI